MRMTGSRGRARWTRRGTVAPALALVLMSLYPAQPTARASDLKLPSLKGITTVVGSDMGWMNVRLPRDVDPWGTYEGSVDDQPAHDLRGNGRVIGFVLTEDNSEVPLGQGPTLVGHSIGKCMKRGCRARGFLVSWIFASNLAERDGKQVLPAGRYRLYLIADGAPVRMRLEFAGLKGKTRLSPQNRVQSKLKSLRPHVEGDAGESLYWAGTSSDLSGPGFALTVLWMEGDDLEGGVGTCIYEREPPPQEVAYVPPCPAADMSDPNLISADDAEVGYFGLTLPAGMGVWRTVPETPERAGALALWMRL
jgi:hypothetical protein